MTDRLTDAITWTGSHGVMALKGTRIVQAFEGLYIIKFFWVIYTVVFQKYIANNFLISEAMKRNRKFPKINQAEFVNAMKRGLHCAKERVRKLHAAARKNRNEDSENDEDEAMFWMSIVTFCCISVTVPFHPQVWVYKMYIYIWKTILVSIERLTFLYWLCFLSFWEDREWIPHEVGSMSSC